MQSQIKHISRKSLAHNPIAFVKACVQRNICRVFREKSINKAVLRSFSVILDNSIFKTNSGNNFAATQKTLLGKTPRGVFSNRKNSQQALKEALNGFYAKRPPQGFCGKLLKIALLNAKRLAKFLLKFRKIALRWGISRC